MKKEDFEHSAQSWRRLAEQTAYALRLTADDAEDVAQDVMIRLWTMREELDLLTVPRLIVVMARRFSLNLLRHSHEQESLDVSEQSEGSLTPLQLMQEGEMMSWLEKRMQALPRTERLVLHMRQVEQRSLDEMATLLGLRQHTVETLLSNARRKLLEEIKHKQLLR